MYKLSDLKAKDTHAGGVRDATSLCIVKLLNIRDLWYYGNPGGPNVAEKVAEQHGVISEMSEFGYKNFTMCLNDPEDTEFGLFNISFDDNSVTAIAANHFMKFNVIILEVKPLKFTCDIWPLIYIPSGMNSSIPVWNPTRNKMDFTAKPMFEDSLQKVMTSIVNVDFRIGLVDTPVFDLGEAVKEWANPKA